MKARLIFLLSTSALLAQTTRPVTKGAQLHGGSVELTNREDTAGAKAMLILPTLGGQV